jgi:recombination protein RecA
MSQAISIAAEQRALEAALAQIERTRGKGTIIDLTGDPIPIASIPTGSLALDRALGIGGLPVGRIVEVFGPESSGKTTLCYHAIAAVQATGRYAAFIDTEHAMDPAYAALCGVDLEKLVFSQPDSGEDALEITETLLDSGTFGIIAIDSVAALTPKAEIEGEMGDSHMGLQARLMSQALRKLKGKTNGNQTTLLFTNQLREKIGVMFGNPETQPGGRALKFYASIRLDMRRIETLKENGAAYGNRVRVRVVKNKLAPPFKQAEFDLIYGEGFDRLGTLIDLGVETGVVSKSGSYFSLGETRLGQGKQNARRALVELQLDGHLEQTLREQLGLVLAPELAVQAA